MLLPARAGGIPAFRLSRVSFAKFSIGGFHIGTKLCDFGWREWYGWHTTTIRILFRL